MKPLSIRLKLTAWYVAVLLASLVIFGIAAYFAMKGGIESTVDESLEEQAGGMEELMRGVLKDEPARPGLPVVHVRPTVFLEGFFLHRLDLPRR